MTEQRVTCVVVAFNGGAVLLDCVAALFAQRPRVPRIVVADNASTDGSLELLERKYGRRVMTLRNRTNRGFSGGVNDAIAWVERDGLRAGEETGGDVYVLVNQDCIVEADAVRCLVDALAAEPSTGIVGARLFDSDGTTLQHAGGILAANGLTQHVGRGTADPGAFGERRAVDYVTGALCAFRAATWRRFGPFEEAYYPAYFEDLDFCVRLRGAGLRAVYEPRARAIHHEATSTGRESPLFLKYYHRNRMRFIVRHLLVRGNFSRALAAELRWLSSQRRPADLWPALRAYACLPTDLWRARRACSSAR